MNLEDIISLEDFKKICQIKDASGESYVSVVVNNIDEAVMTPILKYFELKISTILQREFGVTEKRVEILQQDYANGLLGRSELDSFKNVSQLSVAGSDYVRYKALRQPISFGLSPKMDILQKEFFDQFRGQVVDQDKVAWLYNRLKYLLKQNHRIFTDFEIESSALQDFVAAHTQPFLEKFAAQEVQEREKAEMEGAKVIKLKAGDTQGTLGGEVTPERLAKIIPLFPPKK